MTRRPSESRDVVTGFVILPERDAHIHPRGRPLQHDHAGDDRRRIPSSVSRPDAGWAADRDARRRTAAGPGEAVESTGGILPIEEVCIFMVFDNAVDTPLHGEYSAMDSQWA